VSNLSPILYAWFRCALLSHKSLKYANSNPNPNLNPNPKPYTIILTPILVTTRNANTPSDIGAAAIEFFVFVFVYCWMSVVDLMVWRWMRATPPPRLVTKICYTCYGKQYRAWNVQRHTALLPFENTFIYMAAPPYYGIHDLGLFAVDDCA